MRQVYKATQKGLDAPGSDLEPTDRFLFTEQRVAICYDITTGEIIEPFMIKTRDSFIVAIEEEVPPLVIKPILWRMYNGNEKIRAELRALASEHSIEIIEK
jgi:hypothetical protein